MSESSFFSDEPTRAELDSVFDEGAPGGDDLDAALEAETDEDLTELSDASDDVDESEDEEDDLDGDDDDGGEADEDDDGYTSPLEDFNGWLEELDDDERNVVESLVAQSAESEGRLERLRETSQMALVEVHKRDLLIRQLSQQVQIATLAARDPDRYVDFQKRFSWAQQQRQQQRQQQLQSPEAQQIEQARQGLRNYVAQTISREQKDNLRAYALEGNPLYLENGQVVSFKSLSPVEDRYLFSARNEPEFDQRALEIQQARQQQTAAARDAQRQRRLEQGQDHAGLRRIGGSKGRGDDPENVSDYLDMVQRGVGD